MPDTEDGRALVVESVVASAGLGGFFFDDQEAIAAGAHKDGNAYAGKPVTAGYDAVREPAESVSIMLRLSDGYIAIGDCASVQYSGVRGREPRFNARALASLIESQLAPRLQGLPLTTFRSAAEVSVAAVGAIAGLGRATTYGLTQALLDAASHSAGHHVMGRVVMDEWQLQGPLEAVPLYAQSGDDRYANVDKMIIKRVPILPHGLFNNASLVGTDGEGVVDYIRWLVKRVQDLAGDDTYRPVFHLDVYGTLGVVSDGSVSAVVDLLSRMEEAARPHRLRVEQPMDFGSRDAQIQGLRRLRTALADRHVSVEIVADEWANTLDDVMAFADAQSVDQIQIKTPDLGSLADVVDAAIYCREAGVGAIIGGTCAETDVSARATTHVGMAVRASQMLAKPGMGVDEGLTIVTNEMNRAARLDIDVLARRTGGPRR